MIPTTFTTSSGRTWDRTKPVYHQAGGIIGYLTGKHRESKSPPHYMVEISGDRLNYFFSEEYIYQKESTVSHPSHYGGASSTYEAIKVIEAWGLGFCLGNVIKYISRAGKKDPAKKKEDLEKAKWYLEREINTL